MKTIFSLIMAFVMVVLGATIASADINDPAAHEGEVSGILDKSPYLGVVKPNYRPSFMMVGNSLTWYDEREFRERGVTWEISAVPGRNLSTMPYYIEDRLAHSQPRVYIWALGTNASPGWYQAQFEEQLARFSPNTCVVLVTPYRNSRLWPSTMDYRRRAIISAHYATFMRNIAATRPRTYVADWAKYVRDRYRVETQLLRDGVHTTVLGTERRVSLITSTVRKCY